LAEAGGDGLEITKEIYAYAIEHVDEFCAPYASVIDIDKSKLPSAAVVNSWGSKQFTDALRHDQKNPATTPASASCCTSASRSRPKRRPLSERPQKT